MANYEKLLLPGNIGKMQLKNRMILSPLGSHTADEKNFVSDRTINYYVERAKGGVGLIISEASPVSSTATVKGRLALYDEKYIPRLKELADAVHAHGAKMMIQLNHAGVNNATSTSGSGKVLTGKEILAPSAIQWVTSGETPHEASLEELAALTKEFASAAVNVKKAGFDGVEVHAAHGYLLCSFLNPMKNKRTDKYGASREGRARLVCEIIHAIREAAGPDFPISVKISGSSYLPGGISVDDSVEYAKMFEKAGVNAITVSAGLKDEAVEWLYLSYLKPDAANLHLAEAVKKAVSIPVTAVGKISSPALADRILLENKADFIALGRPLFADPMLPLKVKEGREDEIRKCLYCNNCNEREFLEKIYGLGNFCSQNPALTFEADFAIIPADKPKKVMVVGGGPGGMEAAVTLAKRGHRVTLYDKNSKLGGCWNTVVKQPHKEGFSELVSYRIQELAKSGVKICLDTEVSPEFVESEAPDAVVVATGGTPKNLPIPGADLSHVVQAVDYINGKADTGKRVVIVGGRYIGMEVAVQLAGEGRQVSIVTDLKLGVDPQGNQVVKPLFRILREQLIDLNVTIYQNTRVGEILPGGVYIVENKNLFFLKADTIMLAVGFAPEDKLCRSLKEKGVDVYPVGDCVSPRSAFTAVREGAIAGRKI